MSTASLVGSTADLEFGTGAASSEVQTARIRVITSSSESCASDCGSMAFLKPGMPAGTRLVAKRAQECDLTVIGVPYR